VSPPVSSGVWPGPRQAAPPFLREVADGVFAYIQPDGGWCVSNAGFVVGEDVVLLVDTAATRKRTELLGEAVIGVAGRGPDIVVNTHHHGDHVFGNARFAAQATIVAHEGTRSEMAAAGLGLRYLFPDVEWGDDPLILPTLTFADSITLFVQQARVDVRHPGPAHTTNDSIVWVPDRRVLFAGDIVMSGVTPYCLMGSVTGSLTAVESLRELGATTIVPGHGQVGGPELLDQTAAYLHFILDLARAGIEEGRDALEVARSAQLGEFGSLIDAERIVGNLHRAYLDLAEPDWLGKPIDVASSFREMVAFHGGLPTCHA